MTTALAEMGTNEWAQMKEQANMLIKTGFLPPSVKTPEQVIAIALTGRELGIGMMEAIRGVNVIQGKPSVAPQLMLALAIRTGQMESYSMKSDATGATVVVKRKGWPEHIAKFGPAEAKALGLSEKDNYKKQASVMYQWRALAQALRFTFPDAVSGVYTFEEMGADVKIEQDGSMSFRPDAAPSAPTPAVQMPQEKKPEAVEAEVVKAETITDAQRAMLFKLAKTALGATYEEKLRKYLKAKFNTEHTSKITAEQFNAAVEDLKEAAAAAQSNGPVGG
jgi:hypothetical protein